MKSHLSLHDLEISTNLCDIWSVSVCGRLAFLLVIQFHCPLRYIPVLNNTICYEVNPLLPRLSASATLHRRLFKSLKLACTCKEDCASMQLHSPLGGTWSFLQFNSYKVGRKEKISWPTLCALCFVWGHFPLSSSASWSCFQFCNININLFFSSLYLMDRKITQNVWSCWYTARSSCTLQGVQHWVPLC